MYSSTNSKYIFFRKRKEYMSFDKSCYLCAERRAMQSQMAILCLLVAALNVEADVIAKHGCNDTCGSVKIPFPFGIGPNCYLDKWFEIECRASPKSSISKPFLSKFTNIEVMEVYTDYVYEYYLHFFFLVKEYYLHLVVSIPPLNACSTDKRPQNESTSIDLRGSPFNFSGNHNAFVVEGCSGSAVLRDQHKSITAGCGTVCSDNNNTEIPKNSCFGVQCCQTSISSSYFPLYHTHVYPQVSNGIQNCLVAALIKSDSVYEYAGKLSDSSSPTAPVVLSWSWISHLPANNTSGVHCKRDQYNLLICLCNDNYFGNAYVANGCQVPPECKGCLYCYPNRDAKGIVIPNSYYCRQKPALTLAAILGLSITFGVLLLVIGVYGLYCFVKRRREMKRRAKFFKRNGGLLLHQQLSSNEAVAEGTKIFSIAELDKATENFNENRILGQGGQGTVYKGMLIDGRIVAIKKAKLLDESQLEQFINEVVILSQINHRNVVKMLGCCLETEVPLLVYEFVSNGPLSQHIHHPEEEDFVMSWEMRLKIAADSASAIAYLHSSSSFPIYHRDIKSANILLDEKHRAKVSDFGSSKTIAIDETHLTTLVQGTLGYLDPEYFQSYQFTDKSDVYSFGVVLLELLTGRNPIYRDATTMEQKNLVTEFYSLAQNCLLSDMLDTKIMREAREDEVMAVVELAKQCINWSARLRPTMKEVAMTLDMIIKSPAQVSTWFQHQKALSIQEGGSVEYPMTSTTQSVFTSNIPLAGATASAPNTDV